MSKFVPTGLGWIPDLPDDRDYTPGHDHILRLLRSLKRYKRKTLPKEVDLRRDEDGEYFTAPEDQGSLNCSCAFSILSLVEYFERRGRGRTFDGSKLFLYKATRNRVRMAGDTGADLRTTLKVLVQFGVVPEEHLPYDIERFDAEPSVFLYHLAKPFTKLKYLRLDEPNYVGDSTLLAVKSFLAAGFPIAFGFPVPTSLTSDANIPFRFGLDSYRRGHAAVAVGYRDNHSGPSKNALLIRNSWGIQWGDQGYGWLPYIYVQQQLARDFWTLINEDWLDRTEFFRPSILAP